MSARSGSESASASASESERRGGPSASPRDDFRFTCEDCAHFVAETGVCANGYPNAEHRRGAPTIVFCKEFELA